MHSFIARFSYLLSAPVCARLTLAALVMTFCVSLTFGQEHRKPWTDRDEPMEEYDQPPALFYTTGVSPAMDAPFGGFVSHQVNVNSNGQNITGDAGNEPSIVVDPTNHNRMAIGWRQFNSVGSNFRQGGYGYTTDGGTTWTFPGVLENNVFRSDPVLFAQEDGKFFYNSLLQTFFDNIYRSLDFGATWTNLQPAGQNATGGDKQWHLIDNIPTSTGYHFQYQAWSTSGNNWQGRQFSRSTDGGVTWQSPVNIPGQPIWGTLDVDTNGNVFVGGEGNNFLCVRSSNAKNGTVTPSFDQSTVVDLGGDLGFSEPINPEGLVGQSFLYIDRSGTSTNNNIYMGACVIPTGFSTGSDFMFARSTNGGVSFSPPVRINDDPINHNKWHWQGTFGVAPNGRIDAVWLDTRNAANNNDSQLFYSYSTDAGATWAANVAVGPSFNPHIGYPQQNKMGDYMTIISDSTGGDVAYAATYNNEEDVYYVRVGPAGGPSPTPTPTPPATPTPTPTPPVTPTPTPPTTPTPTPPTTPTPTPTTTPTPPATPTPSPSPSPSVSPSPRTAFDYDGDHFADVSVFRPSEGAWYIMRSRDGFTVTTFGLSTDKIVPADLDGDTKTDLAVYRPSSGTWFIVNSSDASVRAVQFGTAEDLPTPADFDGDGHADIAVYRPSSGVWYRLDSSTGQFRATQFGISEDKPVAGDYDGDGRADIAVYRPSSGIWYRLNSSTGFSATQFGASGDLTTPADFDGDGRTDIAVYRPGNGSWYILRSTLGFMGLQFGISTDIPAAADFDGDGKADITVFRPSDNHWYRLNSLNGSFIATPFGVNGDRPTPAAFRY